MTWNWQQTDWPNFTYQSHLLQEQEAVFQHRSGLLVGSIKHLDSAMNEQLRIELISDEALQTSAIEGEILNRDSVQSSVRREFGLTTDNRKIPPAEHAIAEMTVDVYRSFAEPLSHQTLFHWHQMLTEGRRDLTDIGAYRTHPEPMVVVSGRPDKPTIHFEAPPSAAVSQEMQRFLTWFNESSVGGPKPLPALTRTSIAHLYFVSIHPFEDGNGRIGRAIALKALSQSSGLPTLIALSDTIERRRKAYYQALEAANKSNSIDAWLMWFGQTILEAQESTQRRAEFLIAKTKLMDRLRGQLNLRQEKALLRVLREGPDGFKGGLNADKYIAITQASRATATRDLQDLVEKGAFTRTGERKHTRYHLLLKF